MLLLSSIIHIVMNIPKEEKPSDEPLNINDSQIGAGSQILEEGDIPTPETARLGERPTFTHLSSQELISSAEQLADMDLFGKALYDYYRGEASDLFFTIGSNKFKVDCNHYFRNKPEDLTPLEKLCLQLCKGRALDIGCGTAYYHPLMNTILWIQG